ncbi:iron-enterobactin ABC transporter permease [Streptomyces sp. CWNU-1]|uniref:Iron-enterobactin ABC transporter permease n=2 Tax=Streptomyces albipurpureus TaxID=2897419 RepID=A0ABT0UQ57_9ACTN|nr:iron-enterobactin ABC transporter permease [Streptomyces sp. CWNU-1]MCM2389498.1 iron-enterobactin ABC transporter permease [Streptomyces sp. CWNU-1]
MRLKDLRGGRLSLRLDTRATALCLLLLTATSAIGVLTLGTGEYTVPTADVIRALLGDATHKVHMVVVEWRLPRVLLAVLCGAALGVSGAIFQSLTRNPLGSPDIIGFNTGANTGALAVIMLANGGYYQVAAGAMAGGVVTAAVVYLLAYRRGIQGFRLIIVGIGISALLASFNTWMTLKADLETAMAAAVWGAGSLNGLSWEQLGPVSVVLALLLPVVLFLANRMRMLEMGDDTARSLGVRVEPNRLALVVTGVALTALVTAAAGPISFIALAAPQLARRLVRSPGVSVLPSAAMGAALLVTSDWLAQRAFAPIQLPVGVVTVSIGGVYLIWLLLGEARRQ